MHTPLFLCSIALIAHLSTAQSRDPAPSPPNTEFLRVGGVGTYNYICKNNKYEFADAAGELQDLKSPIKVGTFSYKAISIFDYADATFQVGGNSSAVIFRQIDAAVSSNPNSLPNALFNVTSTFNPGTLDGATYVSRINTQGGLAPGPTCTNNQTAQVAFNAAYVFYKNGPVSAADPRTGNPLNTLTNMNKFTDSLLGVGPVKVVYNESQTNPWQVVNYDGTLSGSFATKQEAITSACGIQKDACTRRASATGNQSGAQSQDCSNQATQCASASL